MATDNITTSISNLIAAVRAEALRLNEQALAIKDIETQVEFRAKAAHWTKLADDAECSLRPPAF